MSSIAPSSRPQRAIPGRAAGRLAAASRSSPTCALVAMATANIGTIRGERRLRRRTQANANRFSDSHARQLAIGATRSESVAGMGHFLLRCCAILAALFLAAPASAHPVPVQLPRPRGPRRRGRRAHPRPPRRHRAGARPRRSAGRCSTRPCATRTARAIERYLASRIAFERGGFQRAEWGAMAVVDENEALELTFTIPGRARRRAGARHQPVPGRPQPPDLRQRLRGRRACASSSSSRPRAIR